MYDSAKPHNAFISEQIKRTWKTKFVRVFGDYQCKKLYNYCWEVDHTDGIGTKGQLHWQHRTFQNAILDALAMNINDLQMYKAKPYKLQNHIMLPQDDQEAIRSIITYLADECVEREIAITGGECAIHDDMRGMEISITMSGFVDKNCDLEVLERGMQINNFCLGDTLIGLSSNGIHSNGFTLVRKLMQEHGSAKLPFRDTWLTPTRIYNIEDCSSLINGIQHITGGAFLKLKKRLDKVDVVIHRNHELFPQEEFVEIYRCTYDNYVMYRNFNCGIGMVLSVDPKNVDSVMAKVGGYVIGEVIKGTGCVRIDSKFNDLSVLL